MVIKLKQPLLPQQNQKQPPLPQNQKQPPLPQQNQKQPLLKLLQKLLLLQPKHLNLPIVFLFGDNVVDMVILDQHVVNLDIIV